MFAYVDYKRWHALELMAANRMRKHELGHNRTSNGVRRHWDIRLASIGLLGAFAGGLYTMFPFAGGNNMPDEYLLRVNAEIHDVELPTREFLEQTRAASRARRAEVGLLAEASNSSGSPEGVRSTVPDEVPVQDALPPPMTPPPAPPAPAIPLVAQ